MTIDELKNTVQHGDCLELMKAIPANSVDMILCDLPYGFTQNKWDVIITFEPLWEQYKRVIKSDGKVVLTAVQPFTSALVMSNQKWFKYEMIWEKEQGSGFLNAKKQPLRSHESILIFSKKQGTYNPQMVVGTPYKTTSGGKVSSNYGKFNVLSHTKKGERYPKTVHRFVRDKGLHSTQKPLLLFEYLIKTYTNEGDVVLDNCAGSGTSGLACMNTNRNYILMEKEQQYIDVINKRLTGNE